MAPLEDRYRRLLFTYPQEYRREHDAEILTTLVEAAEPGRRLPSLRETGGLIVGGLRTGALLAARQGGAALCADAFRLVVVLLLGMRISNYTSFIHGLVPPHFEILPLFAWVAPVLLMLALVAVVRGATRIGLALILAGGVASMQWTLPSGLFVYEALGANPTSPQTVFLALAAVLLLAVRSLQRVQRPWSWWLAVAVIAGPMLNREAHQWYLQYVVARLHGAQNSFSFQAMQQFDSILSFAVPGVLIALALLARDARASIAAAVFAAAGLLATLYSSDPFASGYYVYGWDRGPGPGSVIEPALMTISAVTTLMLVRGAQRLRPPGSAVDSPASSPRSLSSTPQRKNHMVARRGFAAAVLLAFGVGACGVAARTGLVARQPGGASCLRQTPLPSPVAAVSASLDISRYEVPGTNPAMQHIVTGADGNLWFAGGTVNTDDVGRVTASGTITLFHPPTKLSSPSGITWGPDGNVWFTESRSGKIGRLVPSTGRIDEFALPRPSTRSTARPTSKASTPYAPEDILNGPDGNLWFVAQQVDPGETVDGFVGRVTPGGVITLFVIPGSRPISLHLGADGNLWSRLATTTACNPIAVSSTLARTTMAGDVELVSEDSPQFAGYSVGPDGNRWWLTSAGMMRRTAPSGQVSLFATDLPPGFDAPEFYQFVFGADRNIWYAAGGPGIYRMTLSGKLSRFEVSQTSAPFAVTVGPDDRLWFVDLSSAVHPFVGAFRAPSD